MILTPMVKPTNTIKIPILDKHFFYIAPMINKKQILNKVFPNNIFDITCFINNISSMTYSNEGYELEMRIVDTHNNISCLETTYKSFPLDGFEKITYSDIITMSYKTNIQGVRLRSDIDRTQFETKTNINTLFNFKHGDKQSILPLVIKLNIEQVQTIDESLVISNVVNYQRRQRISYCSKQPLLKNWRIDKTVRFFTDDIDNIKLRFHLDEQNVITCEYYDTLDIEIEYIGDFQEFEMSLFKLFEHIFRDDFRTFNIKYNEINNVLKQFNTNLSSISSEVGIITNNFIANTEITDYVYEEKFDGEKVCLIVFNESIYEYTKKYFKEIYNSDINLGFAIVDVEKVMLDQPLYIIFDCLLIDNKWLDKFDYITRLRACEDFVKTYGEYINCHRPKCYRLSTTTKWAKLLMLTEQMKTSKELHGVNIDGLILHKIKTPFINGEIYKLKNTALMTTDFLLKWLDDKQTYYIYTIGFPQDIMRRYSIINPYSVNHFGYSLINKTDSSYILFDNPYIFNIYEFTPMMKWMDTNNPSNTYYTDEHITNINTLLSNMIAKPLDYNGRIVELSLYKKNNGFYIWLPMRVRNDKINPNGYKVGISNIETIYNKLSVDNIQQTSHEDTPMDTINKHWKQLIDNQCLDKNKQLNIVVNIKSNTYCANNIIDYISTDNIYYISTDKTTLVNNFNNIKHTNNTIINVSCIHYDDINTIYNKLLYSSFVPQSISLFINNDETIRFDNNMLNKIMEHKGVVINVC